MTQARLQLDVRALPPRERHSEIFRTFDSLQPDQAFVLVNDHYPKPLLYQFQAERSARFEWNVLEDGPERFRVEIRRRAAASPRNAFEYLQSDHHRLDRILEESRRLVEAKAFVSAISTFGEFSCGLSRHIQVEEQILFPAFEAGTGLLEGPTGVMRQEHVEIRRLMRQAAQALVDAEAGQFSFAVEQLLLVVGDHNRREEQILYPLTDRAVGGDRERDDLVKRMQAS